VPSSSAGGLAMPSKPKSDKSPAEGAVSAEELARFSQGLQALLAEALHESEALDFLAAWPARRLSLPVLSEALRVLQSQRAAGLTEQLAPLKAAQPFDCCGTGGSGLGRFNTSTAVAFALAATGVKVAKFGNRAATGRSGSFDFLEALGRPPGDTLTQSIKQFKQTGLTFLYAPQVYPGLKRLGILRKRLKAERGVVSLFNYLGPLLNPLQPPRRVIGVANAQVAQVMASYLAQQPSNVCSVLCQAAGGLDELAPGQNNRLWWAQNGQVQSTTLDLSTTAFAGYEASLAAFDWSAEANVRRFLQLLKQPASADR
jgi:anthranilate phosphoribosyltransferase